MTTYITVTGTCGGDPDFKFTPGGTAVANFSLADGHRKKVDGNWVDGDTTWYRVAVWEDMAQNVADSIQKGTRVTVTGRLENRPWEDVDGNKRYSLEITATDVAVSLRWATAQVEKTERTDNVSSSRAKPADGESPFS